MIRVFSSFEHIVRENTRGCVLVRDRDNPDSSEKGKYPRKWFTSLRYAGGIVPKWTSVGIHRDYPTLPSLRSASIGVRAVLAFAALGKQPPATLALLAPREFCLMMLNKYRIS